MDFKGRQGLLPSALIFQPIRKIWILYTVLGGLGLIVSFFVSTKAPEAQQQEVELGLKTEERNRKLGQGQKAGINTEACILIMYASSGA